MTAERIAKAPKLKMIVTAGIGSDHADLQAAIEREHHRRRSHLLQQHQRGRARGDDDPVAGAQLHSLLQVGRSRAAGTSPTASRAPTTSKACTSAPSPPAASAWRVLRRLKPFDVKLHYTDRHRLPESVEKELNLTYHPNVGIDGQGLRRGHDQLPAASGDRAHVQRRSRSQDEARRLSGQHGARQDLRSRRDRARAGKRPARRLRRRRLVPAAAAEGSSLAHHAASRHDAAHLGHQLSAQARYAAGTREILECCFEKRPIRNEYLIVQGGKLAGVGAHSYSAGNATKGSDEAAKFKGA